MDGEEVGTVMDVQESAGFSVPVLLYHRVVEAPDSEDSLAASVERFERQMRFLGQRGIRGISLRQATDPSRRPGKESARVVALTFDDGYEDFLLRAYPILKHQGFSATVFVVTDRVGGRAEWETGDPPLLGWDAIRALGAEGIEFGSHTRTHPRLDRLPESIVRDEIAGSKRELEERLGTRIRWLSYPYGASNAAVRSAAREAGYEGAFGVLSGEPGPFNRVRLECGERDGRIRMALKVRPWYGRVARVAGKLHRLPGRS